MPPEEARIIPAAAIPDVSSATPEQRLLDRLSSNAQTTPDTYTPALTPTSEQRVLEELSGQSKTTAATTPGVANPAPPPTSEQRALMGLMGETNRPKDDLDHMIEEALKMGDLVGLSYLGNNSNGSWYITRILTRKHSPLLTTTSQKTNTRQTLKTPPMKRNRLAALKG